MEKIQCIRRRNYSRISTVQTWLKSDERWGLKRCWTAVENCIDTRRSLWRSDLLLKCFEVFSMAPGSVTDPMLRIELETDFEQARNDHWTALLLWTELTQLSNSDPTQWVTWLSGMDQNPVWLDHAGLVQVNQVWLFKRKRVWSGLRDPLDLNPICDRL